MFENLMFEGDITEEEGYEKLEEEIIHGMVLWFAEKDWKEVKKTPPLRSLSELDVRGAKGALTACVRSTGKRWTSCATKMCKAVFERKEVTGALLSLTGEGLEGQENT